jgi:general secretion pathway protein J
MLKPMTMQPGGLERQEPIAGARRSRALQIGFTLIELMVAVSLMAVLSVICWRGLDTVLRARDNLAVVGDELKSMTIAFTQFDEDLRRSWPMRQLVPQVPSIRAMAVEGGGSIDLELLREGGGALDPVRAERVRYRLDKQTLQRGFSPYVAGAAAQLNPWVWQDLIGQVQSTNFKLWVKGQGWIAAEALIAATNANTAAVNPPEILGVEVQIRRVNGELFKRIYSVRD